MRVSREELLKVLESVSPGLASRETFEQATCLVFDAGRVITFNDEIFCSRQLNDGLSTLAGLKGAVKAKPVLELLSKLSEDLIDVDQTVSEFLIKGQFKKSGIRMEARVLLPIEAVEIPNVWKPLEPEFNEAVSLVHCCAGHDQHEYVMTCVHIHPEYLEACDRVQIMRYFVKMDISQDVIVRAKTLKGIVGFGMTEFSETKSWLHFRNPAGLIISLRLDRGKYQALDTFLECDQTSPVTLPGGLDETISKAEIFSSDNAIGNRLLIDLKEDVSHEGGAGRVMIEGKGSFGFHLERKSVTYSGPPIQFFIRPKLLLEVTKKSNTCLVGGGRLFVKNDKYVYVTCTIPEPTSVAG